VAFGLVLCGQFLAYPNWLLLVYVLLGFMIFHRQVLSEEYFLKSHYGTEYQDYCRRVRRYL
jgi:protein-S-isoprenylcysteine O-methyltransferase Ste14